MKKLNKKVPIIGGAVIGVILVIYIILCFLASGNGFIKNMTINGIKVNNMSKDEVVSLLEKQYKKDQEYLLFNLKADGKKYQIDMTNNVTIDIDKEVSAIQKKYNNFFTKGYHYLLNHNENISINIKDKKTLNQAIKDSKILEDSTLVPTSYKVEKTFGRHIYLIIKRTFDVVLSAIGLIILSPVFLIIMICVIAEDGSNPFYGHIRIGKNGKKICVYKFRSMKNIDVDIENILTPEQLLQYRTEFKIDNDPRITKVGNFLRKSSLDELPQLINILKGDISIVGPRPIVEREIEIYGKDTAKLLSVQPGLTGYWQAYA